MMKKGFSSLIFDFFPWFFDDLLRPKYDFEVFLF